VTALVLFAFLLLSPSSSVPATTRVWSAISFWKQGEEVGGEGGSCLEKGGELGVGLLQVFYLGKCAPLVGTVLGVHLEVVRLKGRNKVKSGGAVDVKRGRGRGRGSG
jgi:hypothetical protein